jgi:hypothetical protein
MAEISGNKISGTGGNGQSGKQPMRYIPDMQSLGSTGKETLEQQSAAPMAEQSAPSMSSLPNLLSETTNLEEPITAGVDFGPGPGTDSLPYEFSQDPRQIENLNIVKRYLPDLVGAAQLPDAPDTYKAFLSFLVGQVYKG